MSVCVYAGAATNLLSYPAARVTPHKAHASCPDAASGRNGDLLPALAIPELHVATHHRHYLCNEPDHGAHFRRSSRPGTTSHGICSPWLMHLPHTCCCSHCSWLQGIWALPRKIAKVEPLMDGPASVGPAGRTASIAAWHASKVAAHLRAQDAGTRCPSGGNPIRCSGSRVCAEAVLPGMLLDAWWHVPQS